MDIYICQVVVIQSLRGLVMVRCDKYELWVLQEAALGSCNGSGHYNIDSCNNGSRYNIDRYIHNGGAQHPI